MTSTASVHIRIETSPLIAELTQRLSVLGELVPRPVEIIERIRGLACGPAGLDLDRVLAVRTGEQRIVLELTRRGLELLAAVAGMRGISRGAISMSAHPDPATEIARLTAELADRDAQIAQYGAAVDALSAQISALRGHLISAGVLSRNDTAAMDAVASGLGAIKADIGLPPSWRAAHIPRESIVAIQLDCRLSSESWKTAHDLMVAMCPTLKGRILILDKGMTLTVIPPDARLGADGGGSGGPHPERSA